MTQSNTPTLGPVTYNAAEEAFEALVTFSTANGPVRRAVAYPARLNMSKALVRHALLARAKVAHLENSGMKSAYYASGTAPRSNAGKSGSGLIEKTRTFFTEGWNKAA